MGGLTGLAGALTLISDGAAGGGGGGGGGTSLNSTGGGGGGGTFSDWAIAYPKANIITGNNINFFFIKVVFC